MKLRHATSSARSGFVLLWAIFLTLVMLSSSFVMWTMSSTSERVSTNNREGLAAQLACDAAAVHAMQRLTQALELGATFPIVDTVTLGEYEASYTIDELAGGWATEQTAGGLWRYVSPFGIECVAKVGGNRRTARRVVRAEKTPLFQFAYFYENEMVWMRPQKMTVKGRVHCNSDIYIGAVTDLRFDTNYFRAAGDVYCRPPSAGYPALTYVPTEIRRWVADPFDPSEPSSYQLIYPESSLSAMGVPSLSGTDSDFAGWDDNSDGDFVDLGDWLPFAPWAMEQWASVTGGSTEGFTVATKEHGVGYLQAPPVQSLDMFVPAASGVATHAWNAAMQQYEPVATGATHKPGAYHEMADLSLITYADGTWAAFDAAGSDVTTFVSSAVTVQNLYDARQAEGSGVSLHTAQVDLTALAATGLFPANGLLYAASYGAGTGTDAKGFVLTNGAELQSALTVVSPDSVYVQGDFNVVDKKPAAVIADAVNLLSNSWNGSKTPGTLPKASETTYNLSIVAGDVDALAKEQGGPHNLPRYHEDWDGVDMHFLGSTVCIYRSQKATADFVLGGEHYLPPNRDIVYDEMLNTVGSLPPFTPSSIQVKNVAAQ